jgi:Amt family ammonium transporter
VLWFTFSYLPIAHMVWFWMGPDVYTGKEVVDAMNAKAGLIWQWGALDFAGGVLRLKGSLIGRIDAGRRRQSGVSTSRATAKAQRYGV